MGAGLGAGFGADTFGTPFCSGGVADLTGCGGRALEIGEGAGFGAGLGAVFGDGVGGGALASGAGFWGATAAAWGGGGGGGGLIEVKGTSATSHLEKDNCFFKPAALDLQAVGPTPFAFLDTSSLVPTSRFIDGRGGGGDGVKPTSREL